MPFALNAIVLCDEYPVVQGIRVECRGFLYHPACRSILGGVVATTSGQDRRSSREGQTVHEHEI